MTSRLDGERNVYLSRDRQSVAIDVRCPLERELKDGRGLVQHAHESKGAIALDDATVVQFGLHARLAAAVAAVSSPRQKWHTLFKPLPEHVHLVESNAPQLALEPVVVV